MAAGGWRRGLLTQQVTGRIAYPPQYRSEAGRPSTSRQLRRVALVLLAIFLVLDPAFLPSMVLLLVVVIGIGWLLSFVPGGGCLLSFAGLFLPRRRREDAVPRHSVSFHLGPLATNPGATTVPVSTPCPRLDELVQGDVVTVTMVQLGGRRYPVRVRRIDRASGRADLGFVRQGLAGVIVWCVVDAWLLLCVLSQGVRR